MRGRYKKWAEPFLKEHNDIVLHEWALEDPYFQTDHLALEVGSGKGDFILGMAKKNPDTHFLAMERDVSVCGILAKKVVESNLENIRVIHGDIDALFESFEGFSFSVIYLNFSDPWPKKRHEKRRLTTKERLNHFGKLLTQGGYLKIKTDNDILYEFTLEQSPLEELTMIVNEKNYLFDETEDAMSEYEKNFRSLGKEIHRIIYQKRK